MLENKDYCDYDTCVALKELGYSESFPLSKDYEVLGKDYDILLYEAQKWLREEHKFHITIYSCSQESWQYRITKPHQKLEDGLHGEDFSSYEEALSECIKEAIKILKKK